MGRLGRPLGGCEYGVAVPNAWGRITSKDKPWELAGQIAAGKEGGERERLRGQKAGGGWFETSECLKKSSQ